MKHYFYMRFLTPILIFLLSGQVYAEPVKPSSPTCQQLKGEWINELGSKLNITSVDRKSGQLSGTYTSPSGTSGNSVAMIGWMNAKPSPAKTTKESPTLSRMVVVSFSVNWGEYGSVTSWSGVCGVKEGVPTIKTIWNLARTVDSYDWDHIITNSDTFIPKNK